MPNPIPQQERVCYTSIISKDMITYNGMAYYARIRDRNIQTERDRNNIVRKKIAAIGMMLILGISCIIPSMEAEAKPKKNVVIMIDPGHGGENLGGEPGGYYEKDITLKTANAMKTELEKYENVTVYMTRTTDTDVSLADRAGLAKMVNADFLLSLHYNMSAEHDFYGSEVWTQSVGSNYAKGQTLGNVVLAEFQSEFGGLYNKGTKVKLGKTGADYYGILRESAKNATPAVIVEHCYMDHPNDKGFCNEDADYERFGKADATAVAKYFGLKSSVLGVDYSKSKIEKVPVPKTVMAQDLTPPEVTTAAIAYKDTAGGKIGVTLQLSDSESAILYYSYSTDGGKTWSMLQRWGIPLTEYTVEIPVNFNAGPRTLLVRSYNEYHVMTESMPVTY